MQRLSYWIVAQRRTEKQISTIEKYPVGVNAERDRLRLELAERLLDSEHGSAVFENGKIKKINGVEQFTNPVATEKRAFLVIGRPAGGKSRVFANPLSYENQARILDSDIVKPWLPEFDDGYGAGAVQDESDRIKDAAYRQAIARGENVVIPKIGGKSIIKIAQELKRLGYTVSLYFNEVPEETSIMRAASRFAEEGRYLSLKYLQSIGDKPLNTFIDYAESGIFDYAEWRNNDVGFGKEPILRWAAGREREVPLQTVTRRLGDAERGNGGELRESERGSETNAPGRRKSTGNEKSRTGSQTEQGVTDKKAPETGALFDEKKYSSLPPITIV